MNLSRIEKLFEPGQRLEGKKRWLVRGGVILFWMVCLGLVFWYGWKNRDTITPYLLDANYYHFIGVFFAYLGSLSAAVISWSVIMRDLDGSLGIWKNTQIYSITLAARRLPGTVWYVGGRMGVYQRLGVAKRTVLICSIIEIVLSLVTGGLIGLILILGSGSKLSPVVILAIIVGEILGILLLNPLSLKAILIKSSTDLIKNLRVKNVLVWLLLNTILWILGGLMLGQLVSSFQPLSKSQEVLVIGIWALSGTAGLLTIFLPSSFGVTELTLTVLLSQIIPLPLAGVIAILSRLLTTIFEIVLSAAFYPSLIRLTKFSHIQPSKGDDES